MSRPVKAVQTDFFCQAEHKTPTPSGVGVLCSATGSGHVITCTARRWVVSGRLYCFQRPPAEGRREACKPSTDPTSRITNVRINRTAAHRSSFPPILRCGALPYTKYGCTAAPRLDEKSSQFFGSTGGVSSSAGRKILLIFPTRYSSNRLDVQKVRHRRFAIGRTKNPAERGVCAFPAAPRLGEKSCSFFQRDLRRAALQYTKYSGGVPSSAGRKITPPRRTGSAP